jgi:effector-binding domain-containing protein
MKRTCKIESLAAQPALVMRFRSQAAQLPRQFFARYGAIERHLERHGQAPAGPPLAIYHRVDANAADVEAGFAVAPEAVSRAPEGEGALVRSTLPGGCVASLVHSGEYSGIEASYRVLLDWIEERGFRRDGPFMEAYLNNPFHTPCSELRTNLMVRVKDCAADDADP